MMRSTLVLLSLAASATLCFAQPRVLMEWDFSKGMQGWSAANHVSDLRIDNNALHGTITNWDPFVTGPQFQIPASPWQRIEIRLKTDADGTGEFYWTNTTESPYGGFMPEKHTTFRMIGDGQWHDYQILPFWQAEKKIILLRVDFPKVPDADYGKRTFDIASIRIVDLGAPAALSTQTAWDFTKNLQGWAPMGAGTAVSTPRGVDYATEPGGYLMSPPLQMPVEGRLWVSLEMAVDKGKSGTLRWATSDKSGLQEARIPLRADGQFHRYNVDMGAYAGWSGNLVLLGLTPSEEPDAKATVRGIAFAEEPMGRPDVGCVYLGTENGINRTGTPVPLLLRVTNYGGETATDLRLAELSLPAGVTVCDTGDWRKLAEVEPLDITDLRINVMAARPVTQAPISVKLEGTGATGAECSGTLTITPSLNLPKADYVPVPQPVESDYEIGALYFPGWGSPDRWSPIQRNAPWRKPVLGWYDESNPEIADWQIKWAVEHGIKYFMVDWYWSAGSRHLEHWVNNAYAKSRYKGYLKWCMMWANHNAANTHSEEDQRAVTKYWIDNYFNQPGYYRIDDMPVVTIWSVGNMRRDMADKGGAKRLLDISQEMARAAGYKGIYFVAMKFPEASTDPDLVKQLKDEGFAMTSIYHYMDHGGQAADPRRFSFDLVANSSYKFWQNWRAASDLPFLPNLATGWDARPWHGENTIVISGRTVPLFEQICRDAKRFADETGIKRMVIAPLNEWGEGSYLEPCGEFGFEMYDAFRDVFCKRPAQGWPPNIAPTDVGLGPYDFPTVNEKPRTAWDFSDGPQGWGSLMGVKDVKAENGVFTFTTASTDPAVSVALQGISAKPYRFIVIRMKIEGIAAGDQAQLFWATTSAAASEASSVHFDLFADGQYHDYVLPVGENPRWVGRLQSLRFDPCSKPDVRVSIEEARLSADGK
ncbi:glycoside hydrolase family 99-like domain-containing protein [bacterium]|nr:glycoside hydrolase family 99-like domain-containing protein [bacterium]